MSDMMDLLACDVELRGATLMVTMRSEMGLPRQSSNWASLITERIPGPLSGVIIDMAKLSTPGSAFFAGCLSLLEKYRNAEVTSIVLLNVSDRVIRMLDIMNMRSFFVLRQHS